MRATSLSTVDTIYSADAIEFCPTNPLLFACGTYQIEKEEIEPTVSSPVVVKKDDDSDTEEEEIISASPVVTRYGRCLMYKIDEDGKNLYVLFVGILWNFTDASKRCQTRSSTI